MKAIKPKKRVFIRTLINDLGLESHHLEVSSTMDLPEGYIAVNSITPAYGWPMASRFYSVYNQGYGRFVKVQSPGAMRGILYVHKADVAKVVAYYEEMDREFEAMKAAEVVHTPPAEQAPLPRDHATATDDAMDRIGAQLDRVEQRLELLEKHQPRIWRVMSALARAWGVRVGDEPRPSVDELLGHVIVSEAE